jgi:ribosome-associated protein
MEFALNTEYIELNKLLKLMQLTQTGGEANISIMEGEVKVNGTVAHEKRKKIRKGDIVSFRKKTIKVL